MPERRGPTERIVADDAVVVRAPIGLVYRTVTDVAGWRTWWPAITVAASDAPERWRLTLGRRWRPLRLEARASDWRHDVGFRVGLEGDLRGSAEWWLEAVRGATIVHHLVDLEAVDPRAVRRAALLRRRVRSGLWGLQWWCEAAVLLALTPPSSTPLPRGARAGGALR
ncbi:MAG: hypothetical protein RLZZ272_805 [Actinomycetota bacterium]